LIARSEKFFRHFFGVARGGVTSRSSKKEYTMSRFLFFNFVILSLVFASTSCVSRKQLTYLQTEQRQTDSLTFQLQRSDYRLQVNDIVNVDIRSLNEEANSLFNSGGGQQNQSMNMQAGDLIFYLRGYSVDNQGYISLPVIGDLNVVGMTVKELRDSLDTRLLEFFQDNSAFSRVQLAGIRYAVVGDVAKPGKYVIYQNQTSVFEALSLAGDITLVGDRREVQIIRQYPEGVKLYQLDLTNSSVVNDPRYFIQPNDIINVKPLSVKSWGIGTTGWQTITLGLSAVASALTIIFTLNNISQ
jgi:polysaccharide export outer membrane protein